MFQDNVRRYVFVLQIDRTLLSMFCMWSVTLWKKVSREPLLPLGISKQRNKEYRISVYRMAPDDVFMLLINPPSKNKQVQKLIAKYVRDCYEKRRSLIL